MPLESHGGTVQQRGANLDTQEVEPQAQFSATILKDLSQVKLGLPKNAQDAGAAV